MSKNHHETYNVTKDAANDTLSRMKAFYNTHPIEDNPEDSVAIEFDTFIELVVKGWRDMEYIRHPYDYNRRMANHTDRCPATLRQIYNN